jgi:hypothetical protein
MAFRWRALTRLYPRHHVVVHIESFGNGSSALPRQEPAQPSRCCSGCHAGEAYILASQDRARRRRLVARAQVRCLHRRPVAFAPLKIRWGPGASSDMLRRSACCTKCERKGASLQHPSWAGSHIGFEPFPT